MSGAAASAVAGLSSYAKRMARLSARIFGEVARPTSQQSMRVIKIFSAQPVHLRPEIVDYYPRHVELTGLVQKLRNVGLYRDEHSDFKDEMDRLRKLRGKGRPKKGEGKRAQKKKK